MAKNDTKTKKENPLVGSILFLVCSILITVLGEDYVWTPFGLFEVPLQIVGAVCIVLAVISVIGAVRKKKNEG